jgi:outer membrane protein assembly factor BamD (BamD/ComL family)
MHKVPDPIQDVVAGSRKRVKRARRLLRRTATADTGTDMTMTDAWSYTRTKYRIRSILLLVLNVVLFAGLGCFAFWLRTGDYTPFLNENYWDIWLRAFDWTSEQQFTLMDFLTYPIPVDQVPMMIVIVGLVLASLSAIPILVSILYRFEFSLIFIGIIGFVAILPWLAINVAICCYLARCRRLQFSFRYMTALVSLLPIIFYYILATRNASIISANLLPMELAKLYLPWVLALIGAGLLMGVVLLIAWVVNYRPGAIAPFMMVMFTLPIVLFEAYVGRDELYYRLLEYKYGPGSDINFVNNVDMSETIQHMAMERFLKVKDSKATVRSVADQVRLVVQMDLARENSITFAEQQHAARTACTRFRENFPDSRYIPNALYLEGRALDMRIDRKFFLKTLILRYYHEFPRTASQPIWEELYQRFPDSPLASVAGVRLAKLETRCDDGSVDRAVDLLEWVIDKWADHEHGDTPLASLGGLRGFLAKRPASNTLEVDPLQLAQDARKLHALLVNNRDPEQGDQALRELFRLDPRHELYQYNLKKLLLRIQRGELISRLADNLQVLIATTESSSSLKIEKLKACVQHFSKRENSDALPRALFELGSAYQNDSRLKEAQQIFHRLTNQFLDSPWAEEAERRLAKISMVEIRSYQ